MAARFVVRFILCCVVERDLDQDIQWISDDTRALPRGGGRKRRGKSLHTMYWLTESTLRRIMQVPRAALVELNSTYQLQWTTRECDHSDRIVTQLHAREEEEGKSEGTDFHFVWP